MPNSLLSYDCFLSMWSVDLEALAPLILFNTAFKIKTTNTLCLIVLFRFHEWVQNKTTYNGAVKLVGKSCGGTALNV